MEVGIGLPTGIRDVEGRTVIEWARRAEAAGFSSLGTTDRLVYGNYEPLIALAAAAAATDRIRLATDILIAPLRTNTALLAKQAASIDRLSNGRLVLGLAVGGREDDFQRSGADFHARGKTFEGQLLELGDLWSGSDVGPAPANGRRPTVLIGGRSDAAFRRAARYADGWTMGGGTPADFAGRLRQLREAWQAAGREGEPRTMALMYFALGPDAEHAARENLGDYYAFAGDYAERIIAALPKDEHAVQKAVAEFAQAGVDELICFPTSPDPAQVELLAQAAGL